MRNIIFILVLIFLFGCRTQSSVTFITDNGKINVNVEVADNDEERAQGLMNRESLGENQGMIFVFDKEEQRTFWMKNTLIPLDMIFVGADLVVNEVKNDIQPCEEEPCRTYSSELPAKYVIEVNAGFADKNGITEGARVSVN